MSLLSHLVVKPSNLPVKPCWLPLSIQTTKNHSNMNPYDTFAPSYGMVDITGSRLLPDQIQYVPSNMAQMVAKEGDSCHTPSFPPAPGLFCSANYIATRPKYDPPPTYSDFEFHHGQNWSWQTAPSQRDLRENWYCLM